MQMPKLPTLGIEGGFVIEQVKRSPKWLLELRREDRNQNLHPAKYAEIYRLVNQITGVTSFFTFLAGSFCCGVTSACRLARFRLSG
jgi:hypothetical protein